MPSLGLYEQARPESNGINLFDGSITA